MKMRKFMAAMMAAVMMMDFAACSSSETDAQGSDVQATGAQATAANGNGGAGDSGAPVADPSNTYSFKFNGVSATADMAADAVIAGFGDNYSYFESPSCAFQGDDKVYTYNSFLVRTYPKDGVDYILSIELRDDSISTPEGIYIGSSEDDVRAAYGEPTSEGSNGLEYTKANCTLAFVIKDGKVSAISYNRVGE